MTTLNYPKKNRLLKPAEFKIVFNKPIFKLHNTHLMVFIANTNQTQSRLGMAVTKKKLPTAVARNKVKRIIREEFRHQHTLLPPLDVVFILKKPTYHLTNAQLRDEVNTIFKKMIDRAKHL